AGTRVYLGADIGLGAVAGFCRLLDRVLHGFDDDHAVDRLFPRDRVGDLQQLKTVGANGGHQFNSSALSASPSSIVSTSSASSMGCSSWSARAMLMSASVMISFASAILARGSSWSGSWSL